MEEKVEKPPEGIVVEEVKPQLPPPLAGEEGGEGREEEAAPEVRRKGVPIHPALIRLPASLAGRILTEFTGYPGFSFTEQELNDLAAIWMQLDIMVPPLAQALIATGAMVGIKVGGYAAWKKAGKPGRKEEVGTTPPADRGGEKK